MFSERNLLEERQGKVFKLRAPLRRDSEQRKQSCSGAKTPLSEIAGHVDGRVKTLVLRSANVNLNTI